MIGLLLAVGAAAQIGVSGDVSIPSRYVWRGLTRSQVLLVQPSIYLSGGGVRDSLRLGAWTSIELTRPGRSQLSDLGRGETGLAETNYWIHFQREQENTSLAVGLNWYRFRGDQPTAGRSRDWNTMEVYGSVHFRGVFLAPRIEAWYDVERVRGGYLEGSISLPLLGNIEGTPPWAIQLSQTAGFSAGQEADPDEPGELAYFSENGLTHLVTTLSTSLDFPSLWQGHIVVDANVQLNLDDRTKRTSAEESDHRAQVWFAFAVLLPVLRLRLPAR